MLRYICIFEKTKGFYYVIIVFTKWIIDEDLGLGNQTFMNRKLVNNTFLIITFFIKCKYCRLKSHIDITAGLRAVSHAFLTRYIYKCNF